MPETDLQKKDLKDYCGVKRTRAYRLIHESIKEQLVTNGVVIIDEHDDKNTYGKHFLDLVEDYMTMWVTKQLLSQDIRERGVSVYYNNGGGQSGYKKNDSVEQLIKINAQMLRLLSELGIKPSLIGGGEDDL